LRSITGPASHGDRRLSLSENAAAASPTRSLLLCHRSTGRGTKTFGDIPQCLVRLTRPGCGSATKLAINAVRHWSQIFSCNGIELIRLRIAERSALDQSPHTEQSSSSILLDQSTDRPQAQFSRASMQTQNRSLNKDLTQSLQRRRIGTGAASYAH
jgi:hypothetical protein